MNVIEAEYREIEERSLDVIASEIKLIEANVYKTALDGAVQIGLRLKEAKESLTHGGWYPWIRDNLGYSERQAQNFMKISTEYGNENSAYFQVISKTHTCADLSISKALRLLQVPEEDLENFARNNEIESMTVKELEEEIKRLKEEKEALGDEYVTIESNYKATADNLNNIVQELNEAREAYAELKKQLEESAEPDRAQQEKYYELSNELIRMIEKEKGLKEQLKKLEESKKAEIEAATAKAKEEAIKAAEQTAQEKMKAELEAARAAEQEAKEKAEAAERRAQSAGNEDLILFKVKVDDLQKDFAEIERCISRMATQDPERAEKMKTALKTLIQTLEEKI